MTETVETLDVEEIIMSDEMKEELNNGKGDE